MKIDLLELDLALCSVNKGSFVSFDTATPKKGASKNEDHEKWTMKTVKGIMSNASTSYMKRVLKENPDYVFTPKPHMKPYGESGNLVLNTNRNEVYLKMCFNPNAPKAKQEKEYFSGPTESGPWTRVSYEKQQDLLVKSQRDDYKNKSDMAKAYPVVYRTYKASSITAFRAAKQEFIAA